MRFPFLTYFTPMLMKDRGCAGMYALRERRQHVTQEDFEFAVAKVRHSSLFLILPGPLRRPRFFRPSSRVADVFNTLP